MLTELYTTAASPSGIPSAEELATPDPSPAHAQAAIDSFELPARTDIEVLHDPTAAGKERRCEMKIPTEVGVAVLDDRRVLLADFT